MIIKIEKLLTDNLKNLENILKIVFILNYFIIYLSLVGVSNDLLSRENDRIESGLISDNQFYMLKNHSQILTFYCVNVIIPFNKVCTCVINQTEKISSFKPILYNLYKNKPQAILLFTNDIDKTDFKHIYSFQKQIKRVR